MLAPRSQARRHKRFLERSLRVGSIHALGLDRGRADNKWLIASGHRLRNLGFLLDTDKIKRHFNTYHLRRSPSQGCRPYGISRKKVPFYPRIPSERVSGLETTRFVHNRREEARNVYKCRRSRQDV